MRIGKLTGTGLAVLCVSVGVSLLFSAPALAGEALGIAATFGSSSSSTPDPEPLSGPGGVAVNQETGDVYVADAGNNRVERFSATGEYEAQFNGAGNSNFPGGFSSPSGIAIDNVCFYAKLSEPQCKKEHPSNGDVYVIDRGHNAIDEFSAAGSFISQVVTFPDPFTLGGIAEGSSGNLWFDASNFHVYEEDEAGGGTAFFAPWQELGPVAVDSDDNVYVIGGEEVKKYNQMGEEKGSLYEDPALNDLRALAVDLATNDLYVATQTSLSQYGPSADELLYRSSARSAMADAAGVAVNSTSHEVYVTDPSKSLVDIFDLGVSPSEPKTEEDEVKGRVVTLEGELVGGESDYYFAYNDNGGCGGGGQTRESEATGTAKESATISGGLESDTQYTFCVVAANPYGELAGPPLTFTTGPERPVVEGASVPYVGVFEATLQAQVHPENQTVACRVQYGETTEYGEEAPCEPASLGGRGGQSATLDLKGLHGGTTYHYRVVAENAAGETNGPSEGAGNFTTAPALEPAIEAESASVESGQEAEPRATTLQAQVNPELQQATSCVFEYGKLGKSYEASTPCEQSVGQIGNGRVGVPVSLAVAGLAAGADYHYRIVVKNATGTSEGEDHVFGPPAEVTTGTVLSEAPGIAPGTTATVGGELNPESLDTRYYVQYATGDEEYSQSAPFLPPGVPLPRGIDAGSGEAPVALGQKGGPPDIPLEGLTPGASYHYRLVAYNADGTTYGAPMTVTVPPPPSVGPASVSEVTQSTVTITTSVDPQGLHTVYNLDVGTSTAYGTPYTGDAGSGSVAVPLTFHLTGLHAGDTYHFRLMASNNSGISSEGDQTFTTTPTTALSLPVLEVPASLSLLSFTASAFPTETGTTTPATTTKALTSAQKLSKTLKACRKKPRGARAACERRARGRYESKPKKKGRAARGMRSKAS